MSFTPDKFFIGLMEFFSILLPGMVVTFAGLVLMYSRERSDADAVLTFPAIDSAQTVFAFLICSWIVGHVIFLLGSILDDLLYDRLRERTLNKEIARIASGRPLSSWWIRSTVFVVFKREENAAVEAAGRLREKYLQDTASTMNTFKRSKEWLRTRSPVSLAAVERFEADSKFFRSFAASLVILLPFLVVWVTFWRSDINSWLAGILIVGVVLLALTLWRYMEQRHKATNQAYNSVIVLATSDAPAEHEAKSSSGGPPSTASHAISCVVYRVRRGRPEYLLVQNPSDASRWDIPTGLISDQSSLESDVIRVVHAQSGQWAARPEALWCRLMHRTGAEFDDRTVITRFVVMSSLGRGRPASTTPRRKPRWVTLDPNTDVRDIHRESLRVLIRAHHLQSVES